MTQILRCPTCGALWRLDDDETALQLRCGECDAVFSLAKAEVTTVDGTRLEAALAAKESTKPQAVDPAQKAEETMVALAGELEEFDSRVPTEEPAGGGLWKVLLGILLVLALLAAALLGGHKAVLDQVPAFRGIYQDVCKTLPCPGFVWMEPTKLTVTASLKTTPAGSGSTILTEVRITNETGRPQFLPLLEVKLLDPAGDPIAQRLLEPADYGFPEKPAVLATGDTVTSSITITTSMPQGASAVAVRPIDPLL